MLALPYRSISTLDTIHHTDLLTLCNGLASQSVDMILEDVPYGTTACAWDEVIPFEPMWAAFKRVIKPRGAIVMTASQPFTSRLVCSNLLMFRVEWIWKKNTGANFGSVKFQPMKEHESVIVFGQSGCAYYPQMQQRTPSGLSRVQYMKKVYYDGAIYSGKHKMQEKLMPDERWPSSVQKFNTEVGLHPTQKPVALFDYLIRTYTRVGDVVLDPVCGSGTTAIAARQCGRHFICGDKELQYVEIARQRLEIPYTLPMLELLSI